MEIRLRPLAKGILSVAVPALRTAHHATRDKTASAEYCYSVFLRHFSRLEPYTNGRLPRVVAELGPGDSLGTVLAAVIAGADRCIGLDVQNHTDTEQNLRVFDELVTLFQNRTHIPNASIQITTQPHDWGFPLSLATGLEHALRPDRLAAIRLDVAARTGRFVRLAAPWSEESSIETDGVEWIFSHSAMEHVNDVEDAYRCCAIWLADGGFMTHEIDYGSHRLTRHWNGHWAVTRPMWRLIKGARPFLINRLPHGAQIDIMERNGFAILENIIVERLDGLERDVFAAPFGGMSDKDARTYVAFVVARIDATRDLTPVVSSTWS